MKTLKDFKKWIWLPILLLLIVVTVFTSMTLMAENDEESLFNLSERDIVLEVDESKKVELESEEVNVKTANLTVSWKSSKPSVASVDKDGTIKAVSGGETKITAVVEYKGKEYSTSCVVTVKADDITYSTYKIRWFTQTKDRQGYEIWEETFEREVGSKVELTELDAKKNLPSQYVLNKEKSTMYGTVKSKLGVCVLEVYFDVAEISYSVDYYYESAEKLGTYPEKETKTYKAYAFSEVGVTEKPKAGFVRNDKVKSAVLSNTSVTAGARLKVYCDRIRSKVTINYISGRPSATYNNIYGIGLTDAPADALTDSVEYKTATYVNGKNKNATMDVLKGMTKDTTVDFRLAGVGFTYSLKDGVSTIKNECSEKATPCYAVLKGKSNTLYLSADYVITGSTSNKFGINLFDGTTSRQIRFKLASDKQSGGVSIMMDNSTEGGLLTAKDTTNQYDRACEYDSEVFVWALNFNKNQERVSSIVKDMLSDRDGGTYHIQWAVYEGVLYARIEDQTVLRLPLSRLNTKWNAKTKFEIGISSYDATAWNDELQVTNVNLKTGNAAKQMLKLDGQVASSDRHRMGYDVLSGSYISASKSGAAYLYGNEAVNTGISSDVKWIDIMNTTSAIGVTVKMGDKSVQYSIEGMNYRARKLEDMTWGTPLTLTTQILGKTTPFNEQGEAKIEAFVKDGYFYVLYNGVQAQCINMLNLFPEYTADKKVSVGLYSWDAYNGLATFSNVKELNETAIAQVCEANSVKEWGYYFEYQESTAAGDKVDRFAKYVTYDFAEGSAVVTRYINKDGKDVTRTGILNFMGENAVWQVEGSFNRPIENEKANIYVGFQIKSGDKSTQFFGRDNGFQQSWGTNKEIAFREYSDYAPSVYSFNNIVSQKYFHRNNADRTQHTIGFKAVIYNDTFYVWFTTKDESTGEENTGLCWRIPLTEAQFGAFEAGSEYEIAIVFGGDSQGHATATNLKVKQGYQVTGQTNFTTDTENKKYSFTDAIAKIEENIATYADKNTTYFQTHNISGNLADVTLNSSWAMNYKDGKPSFAGTNMTYDFQENKLTINKKEGGKTSAYFSATSETQVITGTFKTDIEPTAYGITVKSGSSSVQVVANKGGGFRMQADEGWDTRLSVSDDAYKAVKDWKGTNPYADGELDVMVIVEQGIAYMYFDNKQIGALKLSQLIPGYQVGDKVQLGVFGWDVNLGAAKEVVDLSQNIGEDAMAYIDAKGISRKDEHMWTIFRYQDILYRQDFSDGRNMTYHAAENKLTIDDEKDKYNTSAYFYGTGETQVITGTFKTPIEPATHGITIKSGEKSVQVVANKKGGFRMNQDETWVTGSNLSVTDEAHSAVKEWKDTNPYADGKLSVMVVVKQGIAYMYFDNQMIGSLRLSQVIPGYQVGDVVQLGVFGWKVAEGAASEVTGLSQAIGEDATAYMTDNNINLTDEHMWTIVRYQNMFYRQDFKTDGNNMTYSAAKNELTIVDTTNEFNTSAYFYGTGETQVVTGTFKTPIEPATHGITIKSGEKSVQVVANKKGGFRMNQDETWVAGSNFSVTTYAHSAVPDWKDTNPYADGELKVAAYVNQGKVYMYFDDQLIGSLDLTQVIPGYQVGDVVQLGVFGWKVAEGAASKVTGLSQTIGEDDAKAYMTANQLPVKDDHLWKIKREGNKFTTTN